MKNSIKIHLSMKIGFVYCLSFRTNLVSILSKIIIELFIFDILEAIKYAFYFKNARNLLKIQICFWFFKKTEHVPENVFSPNCATSLCVAHDIICFVVISQLFYGGRYFGNFPSPNILRVRVNKKFNVK